MAMEKIFAGAGIHSLALWQTPDTISLGNSKLLMILIILAVVALVAQALAFIAMAVGSLKAQKKMGGIVEELRNKALPILDKSTVFFDEVAPKLKDITANVSEISALVRSKVEEFEPAVDAARATVLDANERTRAQIGRVDGMVTGVLNVTAEVAYAIQNAVRVPVREFSGLMSGLKAGVATLIGRLPKE